MDTSQLAVGQRLKQLRKSKKYSGQQVADLLGLTKSTISLIENGANKLSYEYALIITQHFNSTVEWLLTGKGEMFPAAPPTGQYSYAGRDSIQAGKNVTQNGNCEQQLVLAQLRIEGLESEVNTLKKYIALLEKNQT
jgi:transcriptional regulator with XRE-family HTH domain